MAGPLPSLVLTGASVIVGRDFLQAAAEMIRIFANDRRPRQGVGVPHHPELEPTRLDIGDTLALWRVTRNFARPNGVCTPCGPRPDAHASAKTRDAVPARPRQA